MKKMILSVILTLLVAMSGCSVLITKSDKVIELKVMTHDSFAVSESVIHQFEEKNKVKVVFLKSGDTGSLLNRAILTSAAPEADVLFGIDNTYLSRALNAGLFEVYGSPLLEKIPGSLILDQTSQVTPIDFGDVCINYDRQYFISHDLVVPRNLDDLTRSMYQGLLVVENPAVSSPGLAFLLSTIAQYGEDGYLDYWHKLKNNGVVVVNDWSTAYYTNFSASSGKGLQPMIVSYNTSPAAEVYFASDSITESPTAVITSPLTCFRQIEFAGILKGSSQTDLAGKFIEFMLSTTFQEDIPLQMFMFPVIPDVTLPKVFTDFAARVDQPASLLPSFISENRDRWIQDWMEAVLR
jgi:thiamine transport system substrate-binding protein